MSSNVALQILVAEDEKLNQQIAARVLGKLGHQVDIVSDGKKAVAAAVAEVYDVIFMDLQMPEMDGFNATREIRQSQKDVRKPIIIALSSLAKEGVREKCLEAGMNDYMEKPITLDGAESILKKWNTISDPPESSGKDRDKVMDQDLERRLDLLKKETDASFLKEMIDLYMESVPKMRNDIKEANARRDAHKLHVASHTLKGSSANIGALKVAELCRALESLSEAGRTDEPGELLAALTKELEIVTVELRKYKSSLDT